MLFVTGDVHADLFEFLGRREFKKTDTVVVCGDWGIPFLESERKLDQYKLDYLRKNGPIVLVVLGNHENHDVVCDLPVEDRFGGPVRVVSDNVAYLQNGHRYEIDGKSVFAFGGAASTDRAERLYRERYIVCEKLWWAQELPSVEDYKIARQTLKECNHKVDLIVSHVAPKSLRAFLTKDCPREEHRLTEFLEELFHTVEFDSWFSGHYHVDRVIGSNFFATCKYVHRIE